MSDIIKKIKKEQKTLKGHSPRCINIFKKQKKPKEKKIKNYFEIIHENLSKKHNSTPQSKNIMIINDLIEPKITHYVALFKEYLIKDCDIEFMKRFYFKKESKERIPNFYLYYKNYFIFFLKPTFNDFDINSIIQDYSEKLAEIYYNEKTNKMKNKKNINDQKIEMFINDDETEMKNKILTDSIKIAIEQFYCEQKKDTKFENTDSCSSILFKDVSNYINEKSGKENSIIAMINMMENHQKINNIGNIKLSSTKNNKVCKKFEQSEKNLSKNNDSTKNKKTLKLNNNTNINNNFKLSMPKLNLKSIGTNDQVIISDFSNRQNINSSNRNYNINKNMTKANKLVKSSKKFKSKNIANILTEREKHLRQKNNINNFIECSKKLIVSNNILTFSEPKDKLKFKIVEKNISERNKKQKEKNTNNSKRVVNNIRNLTEPKVKNTKYIINNINIINNYNIKTETNNSEKYNSLNKKNKSRNSKLNNLYTYNTNINLNQIKALNLKIFDTNNLINPYNCLKKNNNSNNIQIFKTFKHKEISHNNLIYNSPKIKENFGIKNIFSATSKNLLKVKNNDFQKKIDERINIDNYNNEKTPRIASNVNHKKSKYFICLKK